MEPIQFSTNKKEDRQRDISIRERQWERGIEKWERGKDRSWREKRERGKDRKGKQKNQNGN